jgi:DNA topoisomerase-3
MLFDSGEPPIAIVFLEKVAEKKHFKPYPLSTVDFQKKASQYLKIESANAMSIAEQLYQKGFISYPRTETDSFPPGFDFQTIIDNLTPCTKIANYATQIRDQIDLPRNGKHSDNAHPPIYPLKVPESFKNSDEKKIYMFIVLHFLACCSKDAVGLETSLLFDVNSEKFKLKGLIIKERNWLDIYPYVKWESSVIPNFEVNEEYQITVLKMNERMTVAPKLLTEPELINLMDKEGIGTDATIAEHIKTIQERGYTKKISRFFHPLPLGLALIKGYDSMGFDFSKPFLRCRMEKTMQAISTGNQDYQNAHDEYVPEYANNYDKIQVCMA